jgi:chromosome segregation ATPase
MAAPSAVCVAESRSASAEVLRAVTDAKDRRIVELEDELWRMNGGFEAQFLKRMKAERRIAELETELCRSERKRNGCETRIAELETELSGRRLNEAHAWTQVRKLEAERDRLRAARRISEEKP